MGILARWSHVDLVELAFSLARHVGGSALQESLVAELNLRDPWVWWLFRGPLERWASDLPARRLIEWTEGPWTAAAERAVTLLASREAARGEGRETRQASPVGWKAKQWVRAHAERWAPWKAAVSGDETPPFESVRAEEVADFCVDLLLKYWPDEGEALLRERAEQALDVRDGWGGDPRIVLHWVMEKTGEGATRLWAARELRRVCFGARTPGHSGQ